MFSSRKRAWSIAIAAATLLGIVGCPDPNPMGAVEEKAGAPSAAGASTAPPPAASDPGATRPDAARFKVTPGEGVTVSGTFTYPGTRKGLMRIDLLQIPEGTPPRLVHTLELKTTGEWKVAAPKGFGDLYLMAFIDQNRDGPSPDDPAAVVKVTIANDSIPNVSLALSDEPDLGPFAPGATPGAPTAEGEAPAAAQTEGTPPSGSAPSGGPADPPPPAAGGPAPAGSP
jgi:hypothetical protein